MPSNQQTARELDSVDWEDVQGIVRAFRQALDRGERPEFDAFVRDGAANRRAALIELIHEVMEVRITAGDSFTLEAYLDRFGDLRADPDAFRELSVAESALRRRVMDAARQDSAGSVEQAGGAARPRARIGRYELGDVIGQGASGVVYRAWDTVLNRPVALKRPRAGDRETSEAIERFVREARSTASMRHPHIVPIYDAGQFKGQSYLVSTLVEGQNLAEKLTAGRPSFRLSAEWVASLADALEHAHGTGVIHRDLKPSNVLIDQDNRAYLTDFGLAKSKSSQGTLTKKGQIIGTPAYMAPEQAAGGHERVDGRTDIYGLGVILYELLTGSRPFVGSDQMVMIRIQVEDPRPPRGLDAAIPGDLETVCLKAMAKEPGRRYSSAADLAADLTRHLRGEPVLARPVGRLGTLWRRCCRRPLLAGMVASLVIAVVAGTAGVTWQWRRAEFQRRRAVEALQHGSQTLAALLPLFDPDVDGRDRSRQEREALRTALLEYYRNSIQHRLRTDPELRGPLSAMTMRVMGLLHRSAPIDEALHAWQEARSSFEDLLRDDPTNLVVRDSFARCLGSEGFLLVETGRIEEGQVQLRQAVNQWQAYMELKEREPAADLAYRSGRESWIGCLIGLAAVEDRLGRKAEARACLRQALGLADALLREQPGSEYARRRLAHVCSQLAPFACDDCPDEAIFLWRRASDLIEPIATANPAEYGVHEELGNDLYCLGGLEDRLDRMDDALADFRRAVAIYEWLVSAKPDDVANRCQLSTSFHVIGRLLVDTGRSPEAIEPYRSAIAHREWLVRNDPSSVRWRSDCAGSWFRLGVALENLGRITAAVEAYQNSLVYQRQVCAQSPGENVHRTSLEDRLRRLFWCHIALGQPAEAMSMARDRKGLSPGNFAACLRVAGDLAAAAVLLPADDSILTAFSSKSRRLCAVEALAAVRDAVRLLASKAVVTTARR
jgi:tetratricopeptide (TPR) repeat protein/tRNA A-37 threonylcarbamoyl transferase component Bud32